MIFKNLLLIFTESKSIDFTATIKMKNFNFNMSMRQTAILDRFL